MTQATSADTPPTTASTFPPPLPVKSRDARPQEWLSPNQCGPKSPCDSPPPLTRSGTARVSFREPISSSYSLDEDEDDKEEELQDVSSNQQDEDEEEEDGALGKRLHQQQKGIPPQMDPLGENNLVLNLFDSLIFFVVAKNIKATAA